MRFTLVYTGELKAANNARATHKHQLRKEFHKQMKILWQQVPLSENRRWFSGSEKNSQIDLKREVGSFNFVPLISPDLHLVCELDIFMLRPEPPGTLVTNGGDIDNRLKTLFDALRIPNENELPENVEVEKDEKPFFCLLEDDALITSVSVKTDQLLVPHEHSSEVHLDIHVETRPTRMMSTREDGQGYEITGGFILT